MAMPIKNHPVSTRYGIAGRKWSSGKHEGVDIACPVGTEVFAPIDGEVVKVGQCWGAAFGHNSVLLKVKGGFLLFAHLQDYKVKVGEKVTKGKLLGHSGADGNVTGPHLHMELQKTDKWTKGGGLDPQAILDA